MRPASGIRRQAMQETTYRRCACQAQINLDRGLCVKPKTGVIINALRQPHDASGRSFRKPHFDGQRLGEELASGRECCVPKFRSRTRDGNVDGRAFA